MSPGVFPSLDMNELLESAGGRRVGDFWFFGPFEFCLGPVPDEPKPRKSWLSRLFHKEL